VEREVKTYTIQDLNVERMRELMRKLAALGK
jgi:hypothetical protein